MDDSKRLISFAEQAGEVDGVCRVRSIGIESPFNVADAAAIGRFAVVATMRRKGDKGFAKNVRHDERGPTVAADFKQMVIDYIERRYGAAGVGRTAAE